MIKNKIITLINERRYDNKKNNFLDKQQNMLRMLNIENMIEREKGMNYGKNYSFNRYHQYFIEFIKTYQENVNYYEEIKLKKIVEVIEDKESEKEILDYYKEEILSLNELKKSEINFLTERNDKFLEIYYLHIKLFNQEEMKKSILGLIKSIRERTIEIKKKKNKIYPSEINKKLFENTFDMITIVDFSINKIHENENEIEIEMRERIIKYKSIIDIKKMEEILKEDQT